MILIATSSSGLNRQTLSSQWSPGSILAGSRDPFFTPHPTDGDLIDLPDVRTDLETRSFLDPSWAKTPALHDVLKHQTYSGAERIFGRERSKIHTPEIQSESESLPAMISPSIRPVAPDQNVDINLASCHTEGPLAVPDPARQLRPRPLHRDSATDLAQDKPLKTGLLARPPQRMQRKHRAHPKGKKKSPAKDLPVTPALESTQDRIRRSYQDFFPVIPLQFGLSHEGYFNPYRVSLNREGAILDDEKIRQISEQAKKIVDKIPPCLSDSEMVNLETDGVILNDLLLSCGRKGSVLDIAREIEKKMRRNKDIENLLSFFHLSVLRVYQHMVGEEEVCMNDLLAVKR